MIWDYAEGNPFCDSSTAISWASGRLGMEGGGWNYRQHEKEEWRFQADAASQVHFSRNKITSTDPPYYDNIGYADLSDFFYVWMRRTLRQSFPDFFATLAVPKTEELVATPIATAAEERPRNFF